MRSAWARVLIAVLGLGAALVAPDGPGAGAAVADRQSRNRRPRLRRPVPGRAPPAPPDRRDDVRRARRTVGHRGPLQSGHPPRPGDPRDHPHRRRDRRRTSPGARRHRPRPRRQPLRHRHVRPRRRPHDEGRPEPQGRRLQPRRRRLAHQRHRLQRPGPAVRHRPVVLQPGAPRGAVGGRPGRGEAARPPAAEPPRTGGLRLRARRAGLHPDDVRRPDRRRRRRRPHGAAPRRRLRLPGGRSRSTGRAASSPWRPTPGSCGGSTAPPGSGPSWPRARPGATTC